MITKQSVKIEDVVSHYAPENSPVHIFLTQDILHQQGYDVNTAVLFVRNSKESRSVFSEIWSRRHKKTENDETYGTCQKQSCLHEQAALQDLVKLPKYDASKYVRIIPQRDPTDPAGGWGINTFHRESHDDEIRKKRFNYQDDLSTPGRWCSGDFLGQATGMAAQGILTSDQTRSMVNLRQIFIDQLVEGAVEEERTLLTLSVFIKDKKDIEKMLKKTSPGSWILWKRSSQATTIISFWDGEKIVDTTANSDETIQTAARTYEVDKFIQKWPSSR